MKSERYIVKSRRTVFVGDEVRIGCHVYRVVRNRAVYPWQACEGCAFRGDRTCPENLSCSGFERSDGTSIWFEYVRKEKETGL